MNRIALAAMVVVMGSSAVLHEDSRAQGTPTQAPAPLPSVTLPAELDRVLRDYERLWRGSDAAGLSALFTEDGFIARGGWIRGTEAIKAAYASSGGDLRLRAVGYATGDTVGYIVGSYRYGEAQADGGRFVLALRRKPGAPWRIAVDLDASNRQ